MKIEEIIGEYLPTETIEILNEKYKEYFKQNLKIIHERHKINKEKCNENRSTNK